MYAWGGDHRPFELLPHGVEAKLEGHVAGRVEHCASAANEGTLEIYLHDEPFTMMHSGITYAHCHKGAFDFRALGHVLRP